MMTPASDQSPFNKQESKKLWQYLAACSGK